MQRSVFVIEKMDCASEEQVIRSRLGKLPGVVALEFNLLRRELTVTHAISDEKLLAALAPLDLGAARKDECAPCDLASASGVPAVPRRTWAMLGISGIAAVGAEVLAWTSGNEQSVGVLALALISIGVGGLETLRKGWVALRTLTLNIHFLMCIAVLGAMAIGEFPEAAVVIFLFALAEVIESLSLERARDAIGRLLDMAPRMATVQAAGGGWQEVEAASVTVGQTARVRPGERMPLDGIVTAGESSVNQAPITGESMPVAKKRGDTVFAGTINEHGLIEFRVTANEGDTTLARIIRMIQDAQAARSPTQRFVDRFAGYYTPAVVAVAVLLAFLPPLTWGQPLVPWLYRGLVLLVIACPCALVISIPVTVVSGLAAAARAGILVKGGAYLEQARRIRTVALDKTGTLTHGKPAVTDIVTLQRLGENEALKLAAALDVHSDHPVARAVVKAWNARAAAATDALPVASSFEAISGRGVKGVIDGGEYLIGNHRLVEELGICTPALESRLASLEQQGKTATVLVGGSSPLAILAVADSLRDSSVDAIRALHDRGVRTIMLTGDNPTTARTIARQAGIDDVRANLLPEDKLAAVEALLNQYRIVGMVGDGINDAPALARASVGFAMGAAGSDTALETADVALMQDDLRKLPEFMSLSRATHSVLVQNIILAIGIKAVFFALAVSGQATLWMAVFADVGASLLLVFNGLRLLRH